MMPFRDGTGPDGKGPLTGRGLGKCLFSGRRGESGSFRIRKQDGLGLAIVGLIAHDIANPDGIIRKLVQGLKHRVVGFAQERKFITDGTERKHISGKKLHVHKQQDSKNGV